MRPSWHEYFLNIAVAVSARGDCTRRLVGAVIVDEEHHIIATGYNGALPGEPGCLTNDACPRGRHFERIPHRGYHVCACGNEWPCPNAAKSNTDYDKFPCIGVHAEENAILESARYSNAGCTLYCTHVPCVRCERMAWSAGISVIVTPEKMITPHAVQERIGESYATT